MDKRILPSKPKFRQECSVKNCIRPHIARGYCAKHYYQYRFTFTTRRRWSKRGTVACIVPGCQNLNHVRGLCTCHYQRWRRNGDASKLITIRAVGSTNSEKFWSLIKVGSHADECWEWVGGSKSPDGYGMIQIDRQKWLAHRFMWYLTTGKKPELNILHTCDNPPCCNPKHLFEGTNRDNINDKVSKNRQARGEIHGKAKLTEQQVMEIYRLLDQGIPKADIARRFGVHPMSIHGIDIGKNWRHVYKQRQKLAVD